MENKLRTPGVKDNYSFNKNGESPHKGENYGSGCSSPLQTMLCLV